MVYLRRFREHVVEKVADEHEDPQATPRFDRDLDQLSEMAAEPAIEVVGKAEVLVEAVAEHVADRCECVRAMPPKLLMRCSSTYVQHRSLRKGNFVASETPTSPQSEHQLDCSESSVCPTPIKTPA